MNSASTPRVSLDPLPRAAFLAGLAGVVIAAGWVQRLPLGMFFVPDDLLLLERAAGVVSASFTPWRLFSQDLYFRTMLAAVGPYPPAFHLVSMLTHLANLVLLAWVLRRAGLSRLVALLAVAGFGLHPLLYGSLIAAVNLNDVAALGLFLVTVLALGSRRRTIRALAPIAFLVALLWKESVLLLPALLPWLVPARQDGPPRSRGAFAGVFGATAIYGLAFLWLRGRAGVLGGAAYRLGDAGSTLLNACTYLAWLFDLRHPIPDLAGRWSPHAWPAGLIALAVVALLLVSRPRRRGAILGAMWFVAGGLPVFVLANHTYAQFVYVFAPGVALIVALAIEALLAAPLGAIRGPASRAAEAPGGPREGVPFALLALLVLGTAVVSYAARANRLLESRVALRVPGTALAFDPITRKMEIAGRAISAIVAAAAGAPAAGAGPSVPTGRGPVAADRSDSFACVALYQSPASIQTLGARTGIEAPAERAGIDLLQSVLDDGRAVRVFVPRIREVRFVSHWDPSLADCRFFLRDTGEQLIDFGSGIEAPIALAEALLANGARPQARALTADLVAASADDPRVASLRVQAGDPVATPPSPRR